MFQIAYYNREKKLLVIDVSGMKPQQVIEEEFDCIFDQVRGFYPLEQIAYVDEEGTLSIKQIKEGVI